MTFQAPHMTLWSLRTKHVSYSSYWWRDESEYGKIGTLGDAVPLFFKLLDLI